jgi:SAM-dependent methyltransferase
MMREMLWTLRYAARSLYRWIFLSRKSLTAWWRFWNSYRRYKQLAPPHEQPLLKYLYPCLGDDTEQTPIEPIYFYQDAWAFEKIVKQHPAFHVDVGSHHKFVALLSFKDASVPSLSSLCVIEHIGLGRYGDPLDPYGSEKAIQELKRVVQPGGDLYISVPLDDENRVYFNAHRAFREEYLIMLFEPFQVIESRYIYNRTFGEQRKPGFGTGCYHLRRLR